MTRVRYDELPRGERDDLEDRAAADAERYVEAYG